MKYGSKLFTQNSHAMTQQRKTVHHTSFLGFLLQLIGFLNPLAKEVRDKIKELVGHGVYNTKEMRRHLKIYVETTLFPNAAKRPVSTNTAYFPTDVTIRNHIYAGRMRLRYVVACFLFFIPLLFIHDACIMVPPCDQGQSLV